MFSRLKQKFDEFPVAFKVTVWYTVLMAIVFLLVMGFLVKFTDGLRTNKARINLIRHVDIIAEKMDKYKEFDHGVYLSLYRADGSMISGNVPDSFPAELAMADDSLRKCRNNGSNFYYYDAQISDLPTGGAVWLRGIMIIDEINEEADAIILAAMFIFPFFLLLAAFGGYRIIKRGFRPVETISQTVRRIGEERNLAERIAIGEGRDEIHQMAGAFNEMLAKLEQQVVRERQFSADVSHELRTPTAVIMAESEYGKDYIESVPEAKESFKSVFQQSRRMSSLINQLLELARIENQQKLVMSQLDAAAMLGELAAEYTKLAEKNNISFAADIMSEAVVEGNELLLRRAAANLLDNAFKFTNSMVRLKVQQDNDWIIFTVEDDGCGIALSEQSYIWERLYQTEQSRSTENNGCGLGLPMVRDIIRHHQGEYGVVSEVGAGSKFYFRLKAIH